MRTIQRPGVTCFFGIVSVAGPVATAQQSQVANAQQPMGGLKPPPADFQHVPQGIPPEMAGGSSSEFPIPAAQVDTHGYDTVSHELEI